ncbi:MAG: GNAT family N-acetyltransferase [Phormidesmis sp.]
MYREELHGVLQLIHQTIRAINCRDYTSRQIEKIIRIHRRSILENGTVLVAEHRSQIVGVAKAGFSFWGTQSIEVVFTHHQFVHQGIGRALVAELERKANLRNIKKLSVFSSLSAVGFYQALDFEPLGKTSTSGNLPCVYMEKQLRASTILEKILEIGQLLFGLFLVFAVLYGLIYIGCFFLIYAL